MSKSNMEQCTRKTAQCIHEIVLALSTWATANNLDVLAKHLRNAAIEAADVYHDQLAADQSSCGGARPPGT